MHGRALPRRFALLLALAWPALAHAHDGTSALAQQIDAALKHHGVKGATLGAQVVDLASGQVLYEHNADQPMMPASNAKLVVMAAAIDSLGGDFQFETTLARRGDDLVVIGGGDPALGDPRLCEARRESATAAFHRFADAVKKAGITHVTGRLVIDTSIFDEQHVHARWPADQHTAWYEAPIGGLNFFDNCVRVMTEPTKAGKPAQLSMTPGNTALSLVNKTRTSSKHGPSVHRSAGSRQIEVNGNVARAGQVAEITVPDPGLYFAAALRTVLAAQGIKVDGEIVRERLRDASGRLPPNVKTLAIERTPLRDVLARAGKDRLGMMAEGLIKMLGARDSGAGAWAGGTAAVEKFVAQTGASPGHVDLDDGSGLSRQNRISPAAVVSVLRHMHGHRGRDLFTASLSHCGVDGTLKKRMQDIKARVIAKTGYIDGVRTLAGYAHTLDGRWLAFAFFYNNASATQPLTRAQDQACRLLVKGIGTSKSESAANDSKSGGGASHGSSRKRR